MRSDGVVVLKRAIDVIPYYHAVWTSYPGVAPFLNEVSVRRWSEDGTGIWFMLDSHNTLFALPDEEIEVVEITPYGEGTDWLREGLKRDAERMSVRPDRYWERIMAL